MLAQEGGVDEGLQFATEGLFIPSHGYARHSSGVSRCLATQVAHLTSGISAGLAAYTGLDDELTANQSRRAAFSDARAHCGGFVVDTGPRRGSVATNWQGAVSAPLRGMPWRQRRG